MPYIMQAPPYHSPSALPACDPVFAERKDGRSIGAWQFFCILGLGLFGVPAAHAASFSIVAFAIWTVPSLLFGGVALLISPVSWADLRARRTDSSEPQPA
jgi:hypothetical protein